MMPFDGALSFLDSRSFGTVWYWAMVLVCWSVAGRRLLGVPVELIGAARRAAPDGPEMVLLLDWLSLHLPRYRTGGAEGAVLLALAAFGLTSLAILGFAYGLEMAQALTLLLVPFALLFVLDLRLAQHLTGMLAGLQDGRGDLATDGPRIARAMARQRWLWLGMSAVAVALTAAWGSLWILMHPNGL